LDLAARIRGSMVMQRDLAKAAGVSEVTIRSRMRDLKTASKSLGLPDVA
jgi:transcription initiation factor TFIIIB Brf1 subunit/transcription initiation factor TFIIB